MEVTYSGSLTLGVSVNLTCSSAAHPPAANFSWYRRAVASLGPLVQVGTGQVLSIPSVEPLHFGWYLCKAQNLLGENSSTEVLMVEEAEGSGQSFTPFTYFNSIFLLPLNLGKCTD